MQVSQDSPQFSQYPSEPSQHSMLSSLSTSLPLPSQSINLTSSSFIKDRIGPHSKHFPLPTSLCRMLQSHSLQFFDNTVQYTNFKILGEAIKINGETPESLVQCYELITQKIIKQLNFVEIKVNSQKQIYNLTQTPTLLQMYKTHRCTMVYFQTTAYLSSFKRTHQQLTELKQKIIDFDIWNYQWRNPRHNNSVYLYVREYLLAILKNKQEFFKEREIKVEMNVTNSQILMIGPTGYKKMEVKNMIVNMYHSIVVMEISTMEEHARVKKLEGYMKKATDHPLVFTRASENIYVLVSKDNIIKQLLLKSKTKEFFVNSKTTKCGFFFLESLRQNTKLENLKDFVTKHHYFLEHRSIFHYLMESMSSTQQNSQEKYFNFLIQVLEHLIETKTKVVNHPRQERKEKEHRLDENTFMEIGDRLPFEDTVAFCERFGCDVRMNKVYANSKYLMKYEEFGGKEGEGEKGKDLVLFSVEDWCDQERTKVVKIEKQKTKGRYYLGRVKEGETGKMFLPLFVLQTV